MGKYVRGSRGGCYSAKYTPKWAKEEYNLKWIQMFNLFNQKRIKKKDYEFLKAVVNALPATYSFLIDQVNEEFILDKKVNQLGDKGTYTLILNADLETKYSDRSLPNFFIIKDLGVWN